MFSSLHCFSMSLSLNKTPHPPRNCFTWTEGQDEHEFSSDSSRAPRWTLNQKNLQSFSVNILSIWLIYQKSECVQGNTVRQGVLE